MSIGWNNEPLPIHSLRNWHISLSMAISSKHSLSIPSLLAWSADVQGTGRSKPWWTRTSKSSGTSSKTSWIGWVGAYRCLLETPNLDDLNIGNALASGWSISDIFSPETKDERQKSTDLKASGAQANLQPNHAQPKPGLFIAWYSAKSAWGRHTLQRPCSSLKGSQRNVR